MNKKNTDNRAAKKAVTINEAFCYSPKDANVSETDSAYQYAESHRKNNADIATSDIPIFLDTNFILRLYRISKAERDSVLSFLKRNKSRIVITGQVNIEYLNHRIQEIRRLNKNLQTLGADLEKWFDEFVASKKKLIGQLEQFTNKAWVKDMPSVRDRISDFSKHVEESYPEDYFEKAVKLSRIVKDTLAFEMDEVKSKAASETKDEVLQVVSQMTILPPRNSKELSFLNELYHAYLKEYERYKSNKENKDLYTFPGSGDWKKEEDGFPPYGDFVIYHEMLAYMQDNDKDICFLTFDITKSDWVSTDYNPFLQYYVDTYRNTKHIINFANAEQFTTLTFSSVDTDDEDDFMVVDKQIETTSPIEKEETNKEVESTVACNSNEEIEDDEPHPIITRLNSYYMIITKEELLDQLKHYISLNNEFEKDYPPTQEYFIKTYLGKQKFDFSNSYRVLRELVKDGIVECYDGEVNNHRVKCLRVIH